MNEQTKYRTITREQFLFHEMRTVAKLLAEGKTETQANLVCSMFANGISIEQISIIAKISIEEVKEILSANE